MTIGIILKIFHFRMPVIRHLHRFFENILKEVLVVELVHVSKGAVHKFHNTFGGREGVKSHYSLLLQNARGEGRGVSILL